MVGEVIVTARVLYVSCPECEHQVEGFVSDPRGAQKVECEECKATFNVPEDARIQLS